LFASALPHRVGGDEAKIGDVLRVDVERRKTETALQQLNANRKRSSKEIGGKKSRGEASDQPEQRLLEIGEQIAEMNGGPQLQKSKTTCFFASQISRMRVFRSVRTQRRTV
jgi:seryl-tRNA synthetase